ncbi:MAG: M28 family peptidase [Gemmataceae bacterium]|nr:M28 family peptidase [Gemmataceae bacterium]MDW8265271.1 M28 family peptidase [Gemmataceae bacterium]
MKRMIGLGVACTAVAGVCWLSISKSWLASAETPAAKPPREEFASQRPTAAKPAVPFDSARALRYLDDVCRIGPRISGSEGMKKQQELLQKHFESHGGKITWQVFTAKQRSLRQPVEMANLIVSWHPERERRVILCCHYDTRPIADQEPDRRQWHRPFLSANDGGSGVAFLMELAHHIKDLPSAVGVDFVFFDGEEYIYDPRDDKYFFGSEHFAQRYKKNPPRGRYIAAVLLDMIAGQEARFPIEQNSWFRAGKLTSDLWTIAAEQGCTAFVPQLGPAVLDDHLALNDAGIPAVDIIDFDYPHWHRLSDVPANCSGEPMAQVARVVSVWLQRVR